MESLAFTPRSKTLFLLTSLCLLLSFVYFEHEDSGKHAEVRREKCNCAVKCLSNHLAKFTLRHCLPLNNR